MKQMKGVHTPQHSNVGIPVLWAPTVRLTQSNEFGLLRKLTNVILGKKLAYHKSNLPCLC